MQRSVTILGATGSVGRSTLDLIARQPERFRLLTLTAHRDVDGLAELARKHGAERAVIGDPALFGELVDALAPGFPDQRRLAPVVVFDAFLALLRLREPDAEVEVEVAAE